MNIQTKMNFFLEQEKLLKKLDREEVRVLKKFGAYARTRARRSLRRRKRPAKTGQTPSVHSRDKFRTLKNILFAVDPKEKMVIVGPVKLRSSKVVGPNPLPEILEFGLGNYQKFEFMGPALDAELREGSVLNSFGSELGP